MYTARVFLSTSLLICLGLVRVEEPHFDAELRKSLREQRPRPAVEAVGGNEVLSRMRNRQDRRSNGGLAAGKGQPAGAAVERRQALFQDVGGGVHQAGVDVAEFAQGEQIRSVLRAVKHVARGRIDRNGAGCGGGIGYLAGMQCLCAESVCGCVV